MDRLVEEYVAKCREEENPLTLTGLILYIGLSSRSAFDEYGHRPEFSNSVKRAKLLIENGYEVDLRKTGNPAGSIFALKNMGWSDRHDVEFKGMLGNIDMNTLPDEAIARIAAGENIMAVLASMAERGIAALQPYLKEPLALPAAGGDE